MKIKLSILLLSLILLLNPNNLNAQTVDEMFHELVIWNRGFIYPEERGGAINFMAYVLYDESKVFEPITDLTLHTNCGIVEFNHEFDGSRANMLAETVL
ncbi:MAG: hypothetical protein LBF38_04305, partial [Deltaproteobacteria bacterium]|nr:hypothetical protein [Deltaproteobacteria bacterium]